MIHDATSASDKDCGDVNDIDTAPSIRLSPCMTLALPAIHNHAQTCSMPVPAQTCSVHMHMHTRFIARACTCLAVAKILGGDHAQQSDIIDMRSLQCCPSMQ